MWLEFIATSGPVLPRVSLMIVEAPGSGVMDETTNRTRIGEIETRATRETDVRISGLRDDRLTSAIGTNPIARSAQMPRIFALTTTAIRAPTMCADHPPRASLLAAHRTWE